MLDKSKQITVFVQISLKIITGGILSIIFFKYRKKIELEVIAVTLEDLVAAKLATFPSRSKKSEPISLDF